MVKRNFTDKEKIVFYADKRITEDQIVSIRERFEFLKEKYPQVAHEIEKTYEYVKKIEYELLRTCPDITNLII